MNYLDLDPQDRPAFATRERIEGKIEVTCPNCGHWRPGFLIEQLSAEDALLHGVDWACDSERGQWAREAAAALPPTLAEIKDLAKRTVEAARDTTMNGGCPATIGMIDSDEQSRLYVAGAVSMAQIAAAAAQPFSMRWRLQDNSYADLDAAEMIAMGVELGGFVNDCCQTAFNLKDEIDAAADEFEVTAVDIAAAFAALIA